MTLQIVLEPSEEGGYTAIVPALPGCLSEGDTREEALANVQEAIALYLEPVEDGRNAQLAKIAAGFRDAPALSDEAVSRAGIYADHP
jgi:predicted RNase H-like HicB family nuclease